MKKPILISLASMLLVTGTVFAKNEPEGAPFQAVWDAINDLKTQIANLQLIPGPQGPQGDKGDKGDPGEQGLQGRAGSSLHLFDGNGQDLGILISKGPNSGMFQSYLIDPGSFVEFRLNRDSVDFMPNNNPTFLRIYFTGPDCTGQAVTLGIKPMELYAAEGGGYIVWTGNVNNSTFDGAISHMTSAGCENSRENPNEPSGLVSVKYVNIPFTTPIAAPLKVKEIN